MSASDMAAWVGAVTGVVALAWDVIRWWREGPRLSVRAQANWEAVPDHDGRPIIMVWVSNQGTSPTTVTSLVLWQFDSRVARWRRRPSRAWLAVDQSLMSAPLPHLLAPGEEWRGPVRETAELSAALQAGRLSVCVFHSMAPARPCITSIEPRRKGGAA